MVIKQKYSQKCSDKASEHLKNFNKNILKEKSRLIKSDGTVIKLNVDDSFEVLYPNGTIYRKLIENIEESDLETLDLQQNKNKTKKKDTQTKTDEMAAANFDSYSITKYLVTTQSGNEYLINKDDNSFKLEKFYRNIKSNDSQTNEVLITREDNLRIVNRPDNSSLVDFTDGTRITTFYIEQEGQSKQKYVKIECPGYATTIFNTKTSECTLAIGNSGTIVCCDPAKVNYTVMHGNGEILDINKDSSVNVTIRNGAQLAKNKFCFRQDSDIILEHEDEMGNLFKVNKSGKNSIYNVNSKSDAKPIRVYNNHSPRFFIIHKDSSGTELLRSEDVSEYLADVEVDPMTAIIRDNVQGYPNIMGTTVLRPIKSNKFIFIF